MNYSYTLPFMQRFAILSTHNCLERVNQFLSGDDTGAGFFFERGIRLTAITGLGPESAKRESFEDTLAVLKSGSWRHGRAVYVDETKTDPEDHAAVNFSEAVWAMFAENPKIPVSTWYCDTSAGAYYRRPEINVSEIASIVNTGNGSGLLLPELYFPVLETPAQLHRYIDCAAKFIESAVRMVPAAKGATILYGSGYIDIFDFASYVSPGTDIKTWYSEMMRTYATDPRFAECGGIGFGGGICCEEEFLRWATRAIRHYALEGASEVSQKLTGLVPGRYYSLQFAVADRKMMRSHGSGQKATYVPRLFSARLEGAIETPGLTYEHIRRGQRLYRYVFKATASEARLVLTDTAKGRLNEPGVELLLNYIIFRPYYAESEAEIPEIADAFGWNRK